MKRLFAGIFVVITSIAQARAQSFPANYTPLPTNSEALGVGITRSTPVLSSDFVELHRIIPSADGANGLLITGIGALPLSDFASASDLARSSGVMRAKVATGVALAGAMDMIRPAAGMSNRFGGQVSDYDGRAAAAFSYMHQSGRYDVGAAGGFASGAAMGKVSAGVSW